MTLGWGGRHVICSVGGMRVCFFWRVMAVAAAVGAWGPLASARAEGTLFRGATLFTLVDGETVARNDGFLLVSEEGTIEAVGAGDPSADAGLKGRLAAGTKTVDLTGKIVMPGFVSGHSHLWQSVFRGIAPDGELHPWLRALHWRYGSILEDGDFGAFTRHGAYDQLRHGITTTYNHSHWMGKSYPRYLEQWQSEFTLPQRFVFAWVNEAGVTDAVWEERLRTVQAQLKPGPRSSFLGLSINPRGAHMGGDMLTREIALARKLGLTLQLHYLEPLAEAPQDRAQWPRLKEAGVLGRDVSFAHFIHPDAPMLAEVAKAGNAMIWNPLSNGRLGSGLPDIRGYLAAGLRVGMGVDGQASADISDPFENVRLGLYSLRMRQQNAGGLQPIDLLRLHTLRTAEILGVDSWVGSLAPGKFADFLVIDPQQPSTGPVWDAAATLVFACSSRNLAAVYIGGRMVVAAGKIEGEDTGLSADVERRVARIRERAAAAPKP
jgi:5-methylthioadenosine/S-adenosylhomocysteine deaminase